MGTYPINEAEPVAAADRRSAAQFARSATVLRATRQRLTGFGMLLPHLAVLTCLVVFGAGLYRLFGMLKIEWLQRLVDGEPRHA
jgi:hypothetical protein